MIASVQINFMMDDISSAREICQNIIVIMLYSKHWFSYIYIKWVYPAKIQQPFNTLFIFSTIFNQRMLVVYQTSLPKLTYNLNDNYMKINQTC